MSLDKLKMKLGKFADIEVCKAGDVFTLLLAGSYLSQSRTLFDIQKIINDEVGEVYPNIEVFKNDFDYILIVLKK